MQHLCPEHVEVEICRADELAQRRGLTSELDEMWSYVGKKAEPRRLWHAIDHYSGTVLAYVFGRRQDTVFLELQSLLEPCGITRFYTDGWGAYERHIDPEQHVIGQALQALCQEPLHPLVDKAAANPDGLGNLRDRRPFADK